MVYQHLRASIVGGEFPAGTEIYEAEIARSMGVNRNTVRQATAALVSEGLLERRPNRRLAVTQVSANEVYELAVTRAALAEAAVTLARTSPFHRRQLTELSGVACLIGRAAASKDQFGFEAGVRRFYRLLFTMARSRVLTETWERLDARWDVSSPEIGGEERARVARRIEAAVAAWKEGDTEIAARHIRATLETGEPALRDWQTAEERTTIQPQKPTLRHWPGKPLMMSVQPENRFLKGDHLMLSGEAQPIRDTVAQRPLSRRSLLGKALSLSLTTPIVIGLMAACGSDDEDPTTTAASGESTPTSGVGGVTPTTGEMTEATPTEIMVEPTSTAEGDTEPTATSDTGGEPADDKTVRMMGFELQPAQHDGGTLVIPWQTGNDQTTSPFTRSLAGSTMDLVFESLVDINPFDLTPVANLATAWEVTDDGLIWAFPLREAVLWHDGQPFTAEDVVYTYTTNMTLYPATYENIAEVAATDEQTVEFTLVDPNADFIYRVAASNDIVAEHAYRDIPPDEIASHPIATGQDPSLVIGTGPFRLAEFVVDQTATFERFDDYWDGRPHLDRVVSITAEAGTVALNLLRAGDIDIAEVVTAPDTETLRADGFTVLEVNPFWSSWYEINVNPEKTILFQDKRVRQAMQYALDREGMLLASWDGVGEVAQSILSIPQWSPEGSITVQYSYDPDQANQLLDEAGWLLGADGIREKDGQKLSFEILCYQGWAPDEREAPIMQENWRAVGIEATPYFAPPNEWVERVYGDARGDFSVAKTGDVWQGAPGQLEWIFGCNSFEISNASGYCNEEVDALFAEGFLVTDPDERTPLYVEAQNIILDEAPIGMLFHIMSTIGMNSRVHNVYPKPFTGWHFNAEEWWVDA
jgi:peptide/nickel transport system substrate-binding protein